MGAEVVSGVQDKLVVNVVDVHNVRLGGYTHFTSVHIDPRLIKCLFIIIYVLVFRKKEKKEMLVRFFLYFFHFFLFFFDFLESFFLKKGKKRIFLFFLHFF